MSVQLYCATCDVGIWSSTFHAEGEHRCPNCGDPLTDPPADRQGLDPQLASPRTN